MSTTTIPAEQKIIKNATKAVAGKPVCDPDSPCQPCRRGGLQLMVVLPTVVASDHAPALKNAGYAWASSFDTAFGVLKREATVPVARVLREGYVYLYYEKAQCWDVWQALPNGLTRQIMSQVTIDQYKKLQPGFKDAPAPKSCSRGAANVPAQLISVTGAQTVTKLWLAFSARLWSPYVLQRFATNPSVGTEDPDGKPLKLRDIRGREINPQVVAKVGIAPGALPLNTAALQHSVVDFTKDGGAEYKKVFDIALAPLTEGRLGMAAEFEAAVRKLEHANSPPDNRNLYSNKTILLMLPDPGGVAEQHNHLRLAEVEAKRLWTIGANGVTHAPDLERPWKLRSSLHADMIEQWEAARDAQRITDTVSRKMHSNNTPITEEEYLRRKQAGLLAKGTGWEPIPVREGGLKGTPKLDADKKPIAQTVASVLKPGTQTRLGRLTLPATTVTAAANKYGASKATGFRDRLRGRLDFTEMDKFNEAFKAESDRWDARIARFDRDSTVSVD